MRAHVHDLVILRVHEVERAVAMASSAFLGWVDWLDRTHVTAHSYPSVEAAQRCCVETAMKLVHKERDRLYTYLRDEGEVRAVVAAVTAEARRLGIS